MDVIMILLNQVVIFHHGDLEVLNVREEEK